MKVFSHKDIRLLINETEYSNRGYYSLPSDILNNINEFEDFVIQNQGKSMIDSFIVFATKGIIIVLFEDFTMLKIRECFDYYNVTEIREGKTVFVAKTNELDTEACLNKVYDYYKENLDSSKAELFTDEALKDLFKSNSLENGREEIDKLIKEQYKKLEV